MNLLGAWASWRARTPPFVLDDDREILLGERSLKHVVTHRSWRAAHSQPEFGAPGDRKLHLGLLPVPFVGNLQRADVFILLLNPGLGPTDYFGEYERPEFRRHRLHTLKQDFGKSLPFGELDPRFSWHGGYSWWNQKLAGVIRTVASHHSISFARAREGLARRLAAIELLPYHSTSFHDGGQWLRKLQSVQLARSFVHDVLVPRVRRGEATIIVTRKARLWQLPKLPGIVHYEGAESRATHLSPTSRGGRAILARVLSERPRRAEQPGT
jgi:hypothetical protein